jgi:hypothetical protein
MILLYPTIGTIISLLKNSARKQPLGGERRRRGEKRPHLTAHITTPVGVVEEVTKFGLRHSYYTYCCFLYTALPRITNTSTPTPTHALKP